VIKPSKLLWLHGDLVYAVLRKRLDGLEEDAPASVLETGTARGFAAVCLAKALGDAGRRGTVHTIDRLPHDRPIYWNSIADLDGPRTRAELLRPWEELVDRHVVFHQGDTRDVLARLALERVHLAFLDAQHSREAVAFELDWVGRRQQPGDVIVCDDYTPGQFPGVVEAVDAFAARTGSELQLFVGDREWGRCYAVLTRRA